MRYFRNGKDQGGAFFSCKQHPACNFTVWLPGGATVALASAAPPCARGGQGAAAAAAEVQRQAPRAIPPQLSYGAFDRTWRRARERADRQHAHAVGDPLGFYFRRTRIQLRAHEPLDYFVSAPRGLDANRRARAAAQRLRRGGR